MGIQIPLFNYFFYHFLLIHSQPPTPQSSAPRPRRLHRPLLAIRHLPAPPLPSASHRRLASRSPSLPSSSDPESPATPRPSRVRELLWNLDRRLSSRGRHHAEGGTVAPAVRGGEPDSARRQEESDKLGDGALPEWALLLVGCLLGLATAIRRLPVPPSPLLAPAAALARPSPPRSSLPPDLEEGQ